MGAITQPIGYQISGSFSTITEDTSTSQNLVTTSKVLRLPPKNNMPNEYSGPTEIKAVSPLTPSEESPKAVLWDCVGKKPNPAGETLLEFRLKPQFNEFPRSPDAEAKIDQLFPSVEPTSFVEAKERMGNLDEFSFLQRLGYDIRDPDIIVLPDCEALIAKWHQLQKERPLPDLTILSSKGVASDHDFVQAYITHGALLSNGQEFLHDHFTHLIPLLLGMRKPNWEEHITDAKKRVQTAQEEVRQAREQLNSQRGNSNEKIDLRIQQLGTILGMFTDSFFANELPLESQRDQRAFATIGNFLEIVWSLPEGEAWRESWTRRDPPYPYPSNEDFAEFTKLLPPQPSPNHTSLH